MRQTPIERWAEEAAPDPTGQAGQTPRAGAASGRAKPVVQISTPPDRCAAVPSRSNRTLHQQSGRAGHPDDEGEDENLRIIPHERWRRRLRNPAISYLNRQKAGLEHTPDHVQARKRTPRPYPRLGVAWELPFFQKRSACLVSLSRISEPSPAVW